MSAQQQGGESSMSLEDDWRGIADHQQRRKVQNRNAQRKFREKNKREKEEQTRIADNQQAAGSAYTTPDAKDLASNANPNGLPWGSVSMKHVIEAGKAKEKEPQPASREGSVSMAYSRR